MMLPLSPMMVCVPAPAVIVSAPEPPTTMLLPTPSLIVSLPPVAGSVDTAEISLPALADWVLNDRMPSSPNTMSLPLPVVIWSSPTPPMMVSLPAPTVITSLPPYRGSEVCTISSTPGLA